MIKRYYKNNPSVKIDYNQKSILLSLHHFYSNKFPKAEPVLAFKAYFYLMNKHVYLIRGTEGESYGAFKERISVLAKSWVGTLDPKYLKFTITDAPPPLVSLIPFRKQKIAAISVTGGKALAGVEYEQIPGFCGAYQVTEAVPVAYQIRWPLGEVTPGACLFTIFKQKKNIDYATFIHRWHEVHTPHSLVIHPLWNYIRNVVDGKLFPSSETLDGIVEEQVRERKDLLNPFRFWGAPLVMLPRIIKELLDTTSFMDYSTMEVYLATEYWVKLPER